MGVKLISRKLKILDETKTELLQAIEELADETMELGQNWIDDTDGRKHTVEEIGHLIDSVAMYLSTKHEQFSKVKDKIVEGTNINATEDDEEELSENFQSSLQTFSVRAGGAWTQGDVNLVKDLQGAFVTIQLAVKNLNTQSEAMGERQRSLESACQQLTHQQMEMSTTTGKRLDNIENSLHDINSNVEDSAKIRTDLDKGLESVRSEVATTNKRVDEVLTKYSSLNTTISDVTKKTDGNTKALDTASKNNTQKMKELESKLKAVEEGGKEDVKKVRQQFVEVKDKCSMISHMMGNQVKPLVQLRDILNKKIQAKDDNLNKLNKVVRDTANLDRETTNLIKNTSDLASKVRRLEMQQSSIQVTPITASSIQNQHDSHSHNITHGHPKIGSHKPPHASPHQRQPNQGQGNSNNMTTTSPAATVQNNGDGAGRSGDSNGGDDPTKENMKESCKTQ